MGDHMQLAEEHRYIPSFDYLVECEYVNKETAERIVSLGYYGVPMSDEAFDAFNRGEKYQPPEFALYYFGIDGTEQIDFKSKAELLVGIRKRAEGEYWVSPTEFKGDYCSCVVKGATLAEAGVVFSDGFCKLQPEWSANV